MEETSCPRSSGSITSSSVFLPHPTIVTNTYTCRAGPRTGGGRSDAPLLALLPYAPPLPPAGIAHSPPAAPPYRAGKHKWTSLGRHCHVSGCECALASCLGGRAPPLHVAAGGRARRIGGGASDRAKPGAPCGGSRARASRPSERCNDTGSTRWVLSISAAFCPSWRFVVQPLRHGDWPRHAWALADGAAVAGRRGALSDDGRAVAQHRRARASPGPDLAPFRHARLASRPGV